jgi:outer membrane protein W
MLLALVLLVAAGFSQTEAQGTKYKVYAGFAYISPTGDDDIDFDGELEKIEAADEFGYNIGFEYRFSKLFGLDFDINSADHDVEVGGEVIGDTTMFPVSATLNFHLIRSRYFDFYLGPTASYVMWDDVSIKSPYDLLLGDKIKVDDEFAWGAVVGVDISLVKIVALTVKVRYLDLDLTPDESGADSLAIDPLIANVGVAIRWGAQVP